MSGKVIILMMDSFGVGGAPDAAAFANSGANTFAHIVQKQGGLNVPNLAYLGLQTAGFEASGEKTELNCAKQPDFSIGHKWYDHFYMSRQYYLRFFFQYHLFLYSNR